MNNKRSFGVLLPIFSLPSNHGIGTLGIEAFNFIDVLKKMKAKYWQLLPLNVTSYGDSPYQSFSSNGLNYYFIDLDLLVKDNLLKNDEIKDNLFFKNENKVDYTLLFNNRIKLLKTAFYRFNKNDNEFVKFIKDKKYHDFAFFMVLKELNNYKPWYEFNSQYKNYSIQLEEKVIKDNNDLYLFYLFTQFIFLKQFNILKEYAHKNNIKLIGDMPIYVAYDSIEAYKYPELFLFDEEKVPILVGGCPPDCFSADGQLWGNPIYNWEYLKSTNYAWFNNRINENLELFDVLRIDHFRGFASYYAIPYYMKNARIGKWIAGPGFDFFKDKTNLNIIAEDLGGIGEDVLSLLRDTSYPGMKILQFAFDGNKNNPYKPENIEENYVVYSGTHDNETLLGYINNLDTNSYDIFLNDVKNSASLLNIKTIIKTKSDLVNVINELALACNADYAILPLQDILGINNSGRINTPSILNDTNWTYRFSKKYISNEQIEKYSKLVTKYKR